MPLQIDRWGNAFMWRHERSAPHTTPLLHTGYYSTRKQLIHMQEGKGFERSKNLMWGRTRFPVSIPRKPCVPFFTGKPVQCALPHTVFRYKYIPTMSVHSTLTWCYHTVKLVLNSEPKEERRTSFVDLDADVTVSPRVELKVTAMYTFPSWLLLKSWWYWAWRPQGQQVWIYQSWPNLQCRQTMSIHFPLGDLHLVSRTERDPWFSERLLVWCLSTLRLPVLGSACWVYKKGLEPRVFLSWSLFIPWCLPLLTACVSSILFYIFRGARGFFHPKRQRVAAIMSSPKFAGMSGNLLMRTVTACATMGFLLFGYDRAFPCSICWQSSLGWLKEIEGVMSSIIDAKPFNTVFPATDNNSTMQGTVTAIYEVG